MEHLSAEILARLVDEEPTPGEADHLATCDRCAGELEALREQTEALRGLPELLPPQGDWRVLEARLRSEGLVQSPTLLQKIGIAQTPGWMRAAAAVLLFLSGAGTGVAVTNANASDAILDGRITAVEPTDIESAAFAVRSAQDAYVDAVADYRQFLARDGDELASADPVNRFVGLDLLMSAGLAAVQEEPADAFFNGILASVVAEREAMVRMVSATGDNWF